MRTPTGTVIIDILTSLAGGETARLAWVFLRIHVSSAISSPGYVPPAIWRETRHATCFSPPDLTAERVVSFGREDSKGFMNNALPNNQTVSLILPSPPGVNNLYFDMVMPPKWPRKKHWVRRVLSAEGKAYKQTVADITDGLTPFIGDVWVMIKWYRPRRIGDIDGILKIILDGMSGHIYNDDKQVARLHVDRFEDKFRPRIEIQIQALNLC